MAAVPLDTSHVADPGLCGPDHPVLTVPGPGRSGRGRGDRQMVRGQPPPRMTPECQQVFGKFVGHGVHDWVRYYPDQPTYENWQALPLIVLAGLK